VKEGKEENLQPLVHEVAAIIMPPLLRSWQGIVISELQYLIAGRGLLRLWMGRESDGVFDTLTRIDGNTLDLWNAGRASGNQILMRVKLVSK
jgi:hypothetical protein